jgi:hypothetical protein
MVFIPGQVGSARSLRLRGKGTAGDGDDALKVAVGQLDAMAWQFGRRVLSAVGPVGRARSPPPPVFRVGRVPRAGAQPLPRNLRQLPLFRRARRSGRRRVRRVPSGGVRRHPAARHFC